MKLILKLLAVILATLSFTQTISGADSKGDKVSEFLQRKFQNYDKAVRPYFGEKPLDVTVSGYVIDISDINEVNQEATVTLYLRHEWKDPRLEYIESEVGTDKLGLNEEYLSKLWLVDSFIMNERESKGHELFTENKYIRVSPDGTVLMSGRFTITFSCNLQLGWFPFDRHTCPMIIESYGNTMSDLVYHWKANDEGSIKNAISVSQKITSIKFNVAAINTKEEKTLIKTTSIGYSILAVEFFFIRASTRFVHEIYLPAIILTFLSFITLLHSTGTPKARLQLSVLLLVAMIILMALSAKTIPPVSYQTALDFYLVISLLIISCVVIVNVAICLIVSNSNESNGVVRLRSVNEENTNADDEGKEVLFDTGPRFSSKTSRLLTLSIKLRFVVPLIFAVFNLLYWMVVLIGSSSFPEDFLILENIAN